MTQTRGEAAILEARLWLHKGGTGGIWSPLDLRSYLPLPLCVTLGKPLGLSEPSMPIKEREAHPMGWQKASEVPGT